MADIIFDYSALEDAKAYAKNVVSGWECIDEYKSGLQSNLISSLDEWKLAGEEPMGHSYVESARQIISDKIGDFDSKITQWTNFANNIGTFIQFLKDKDSEVVDIFKSTSDSYVSYSGIGGFFQEIGDITYNFFAVDLANSNVITRSICNLMKEGADDLSYVNEQAVDWFKHGNGKYVLNIVSSVALTVVAIAGAVVAFVGIPFTGGISAVGVVASIGFIAASASALISLINTGNAVKANVKAMNIEDDPGMARFNGDISGYSDYVKKTDFHSKEANEKAEAKANFLDTVQVLADVISAGTCFSTTFFTKEVEIDEISKKVFDFSGNNIKNNVLKNLGFNINSEKAIMDSTVKTGSTTISMANEAGDTTIEATKSSAKLEGSRFTMENKSLKFENLSISSEYKSLVASNNVITQEFSEYTSHAEASKKVIDYSNTFSSARSVALKQAPEKSKEAVGNLFKKIQMDSKVVADTSNYLKSSNGEEQKAILAKGIVTQSYLGSQFDKYVYKENTSPNANWQDGIGGNVGYYIQKFEKQIKKDFGK